MGEVYDKKLLKMGDKQRNQFQWDHTENALTFWSMHVMKSIEYYKDSLHDFFLKNPCYATEKYDGTNVAKDDRGQLYSRRLLIEDKEDTFIETTLKKVKEANIADFRSKLLEVADLDKSVLDRCVVYGSLFATPILTTRKGVFSVTGKFLELVFLSKK